MKLSNPKVKSFFIFSQKKAYISGNGNPRKGSLYIRKRNFLIFAEMEKKLLIFQEETFRARKMKKKKKKHS